MGCWTVRDERAQALHTAVQTRIDRLKSKRNRTLDRLKSEVAGTGIRRMCDGMAGAYHVAREAPQAVLRR